MYTPSLTAVRWHPAGLRALAHLPATMDGRFCEWSGTVEPRRRIGSHLARGRQLYALIATDTAYWHAALARTPAARNLFVGQPESAAALQALWLLRLDANAKLRGITHLADRLRYCKLALAHGEDFADQADWQPLWASMASKQQRLIVALEQFTSAVASPTTPRITA